MISVIIPTYNHGQYILDALASVVGGRSPLGPRDPQDVDTAVEIVIVDDNSQDETLGILMGLKIKRPDLPIYPYRLKERAGTPAALNYGIQRANGEWIAILHADDMFEPWHLSDLRAEARPDRFAYGDLRIFSHGQAGGILRTGSWSFQRAKKRNLCSAAIMFHRSAWEQVGGYPPAFQLGREDWAFTLRLGAAGIDGIRVRQGTRASYLYRKEKQGKSEITHSPQFIAFFRDMLRAQLPEVYSPKGQENGPGRQGN